MGGKLPRRLSVVIPAYNETEIILETLKECISSLNGTKPEIIVVDDGSLDGTLEKVQKFAKENKNVKVVSYGGNQGKGYAVKYGFKHATGDIVAFIDADLNLHPRQIKTMMEYMKKYEVDVIVGSKRHPGSKVNYPLERKVLSDIYYLFIKTLFGLPVRDTQVGLKLYKREVLEDVLPKVLVKRYAFDIEILANAHRLGYKIMESPIELNMGFSSHVNTKAIWNMLVDTSAVFYRMKILKYYDDNKSSLDRNNELLSESAQDISKS
ncbi:Glycosyltransferase AglD [uncultured archaeon]|nr:Glycosyltransferase AglD [uncultured archaeon]